MDPAGLSETPPGRSRSCGAGALHRVASLTCTGAGPGRSVLETGGGGNDDDNNDSLEKIGEGDKGALRQSEAKRGTAKHSEAQRSTAR